VRSANCGVVVISIVVYVYVHWLYSVLTIMWGISAVGLIVLVAQLYDVVVLFGVVVTVVVALVVVVVVTSLVALIVVSEYSVIVVVEW
jgi:hypothetical protein